MVEELQTYNNKDLSDLDVLMHELSANCNYSEIKLDNAVKDEDSHVFVIREDGHIIATGTLCIMHTLEFTIGGVESVVVSSKYRGRGYSKELMNYIIYSAKRLKVHHLHLTSNPKREAANSLYGSMGFERYETNCYRLYFNVIEEGK